MLYEALDILGERVIYYDTNSVIYIRIPGYRLFLLKMFETIQGLKCSTSTR